MNQTLQHDILAYHVTPRACLPSILAQGLVPQVGKRSATVREARPAVFFFAARESCEDALTNWLGEQFDDVADELAILQVALPWGIEIGHGAEYEVVVLEPVPAASIIAACNCDWSAIDLHGKVRGELAQIARKERDMPFLMTHPVQVIEPHGNAAVPDGWEGLCVSSSDIASYWYLGWEGEERSFSKLQANSFRDAVCELVHRKITSSQALRARFPAKGSMPPREVELLYALREAEARLLGDLEAIGPDDFAHLDWGARIKLINDHFEKCSQPARHALLHDEHHFVRSAAVIAARGTVI
ncbi:MAG: hypothetical protein EPN77_19300 [Candidimonas sp.]|nr:MAG: hypothetical protein EPN77_19300 [Candidimonas sp.]